MCLLTERGVTGSLMVLAGVMLLVLMIWSVLNSVCGRSAMFYAEARFNNELMSSYGLDNAVIAKNSTTNEK